MTPVRVGVLGTGTIVRDYHLPVLMANPRAQVVALGNLHEASLTKLAKECDIKKAYTDFQRMADDREIDAVVVALPNSFHAPVTVQMLKAGKHVLCEKPMATTLADAVEMAQTAESTGRKLMIAHVWRFSPEVQRLRELIDEGRLGKITHLKAHAVVIGRGPNDGSWFHDPKLSGGGALADVGIHSIDMISYLFHDEIEALQISARVENRYRKIAVEDTATVHITYDNGVVAELEAGWYHESAPSPHGAIEVFGTDGDGRTQPFRWRVSSEPDWHENDLPTQPAHPDDNRSIYAAQMDHFLDCVIHDTQPGCDGAHGLEDVMVLTTAYASAAQGCPFGALHTPE